MRNVEFLTGIPIDLNTNQEVLTLINGWMAQRGQSRHIITLNTAMLITAAKNIHFKEIIKKADLVTIDGCGIDWALRKNGCHNHQRYTGIDLTRDLLKKSSRNGYRVYFYGGTPKVGETMKKMLLLHWPGLIVAGIQDGYGINLTRTEVCRDITARQPHLLLVGLGSPEQEIFLARLLPELDATVGIGVGGAFEVLSGLKREAPLFLRNHGWEWLFRMLQEPRKIKLIPDLARFWYRYLR